MWALKCYFESKFEYQYQIFICILPIGDEFGGTLAKEGTLTPKNRVSSDIKLHIFGTQGAENLKNWGLNEKLHCISEFYGKVRPNLDQCSNFWLIWIQIDSFFNLKKLIKFQDIFLETLVIFLKGKLPDIKLQISKISKNSFLKM